MRRPLRFAVAVALSAVILLVAGQVDAQYRYTDDKGVSKLVQYKLYVPARYRDAAVWIGPTGIGKPALSEEQRQAKQRDDAYRRIGEAHARLVPYRKAESEARKAESEARKAEAEAAAAQQQKKAQERREGAEARRDAMAEESLRLQRESVRAQQEANDLERQKLWRRR